MASAEDVQKLAALSRLSIPEADLAHTAKEFDAILAYVGKLEQLTLHAKYAGTAGAVRNVFRIDGEPHAKGKHTKALVAQFPDKEGNYLKVKQILSHD